MVLKKLFYLKVARDIGIQGKVIVKALINSNGNVQKTELDYSNRELYNDATNEAIRSTLLVPAEQNGIKVNAG